MIHIPYTDIPTATVQCHAANLHSLGNGALACVWFGGTQEGMSDIAVWLSHQTASGWSAPLQLSFDDARSEQNPILFTTPAGALWLLHTAQIAGRQNTAVVKRRISLDGGVTWGESEDLFPQSAYAHSGIFVRQPVQVLRNGDWLLPIFRCIAPADVRWTGERDTSSVMRSTDQGKSWTEHPVPHSTGMVHMNIVQHPSHAGLVAFYRSRFADHIYRSTSADSGLTWTTPAPTPLPNNNASIQAIRLHSGALAGQLAMVFNHSSSAQATQRRESLYDEIPDELDATTNSATTDSATHASAKPSTSAAAHEAPYRPAFWGTPRAPLSMALSSDEGLTWHSIRVIEDGDGNCMSNNSRTQANRELSYPSVHQSADGCIHVAYTHHRQRIRHVTLPAGFFA